MTPPPAFDPEGQKFSKKDLPKADYILQKQVDLMNDPKDSVAKILSFNGDLKMSTALTRIPEKFQLRNNQRLPDVEWSKLKEIVEEEFQTDQPFASSMIQG